MTASESSQPALDRTELDGEALGRALGLGGPVEALALPASAQLDDVLRAMQQGGERAGLGLLAASVVRGLEARLLEVRGRVAGERSLPVMLTGPWAPPAQAEAPWLDDVLAAAGARRSDALDARPLLLGPRDTDASRPPEAAHLVLDLRRPGPDLARAAEVLAAALHPEACPDLLRRHGHLIAAAAVERRA
jgi:hypothetical protein